MEEVVELELVPELVPVSSGAAVVLLVVSSALPLEPCADAPLVVASSSGTIAGPQPNTATIPSTAGMRTE